MVTTFVLSSVTNDEDDQHDDDNQDPETIEPAIEKQKPKYSILR